MLAHVRFAPVCVCVVQIRGLVVRGDGRPRRPVRDLLHRAVRHAGTRLRAPDRARSLPQEQPRVRLLPHVVALVVGAR